MSEVEFIIASSNGNFQTVKKSEEIEIKEMDDMIWKEVQKLLPLFFNLNPLEYMFYIISYVETYRLCLFFKSMF